MLTRWQQYLVLMRFDKPIGSYLVLWPAIMALLLAKRGEINHALWLLFILGGMVMRALGCVINDYWDRNFDIHVTRTKTRPLANKTITINEAKWLIVILSTIALSIALKIGTVILPAAIAAFTLAAIYPLMKRIFVCPQLILGCSFAQAIILAYKATNTAIDLGAIILFSSVVIWVVIYDTEYALMDKKDDLKLGLKSSAILFGQQVVTILLFQRYLLLLLWLLLGSYYRLNYCYYVAWLVIAHLFYYEHKLIQQKETAAYLKAFKLHKWVGLLLSLGLYLGFSLAW